MVDAAKYARALQFGTDQQERADEAERKCKVMADKLDKTEKKLKQLKLKVAELERARATDKAKADKELKTLREANWALTQRSVKRLKDSKTYEDQLATLEGRLQMAHYLLRIQRTAMLGRGIDMDADPVFQELLREGTKTLDMMRLAALYEARQVK